MDARNLLEKASDTLWVRRAFGAAYEKNGMLIIPVAMVAGGGGAGTTRTRRGDSAALHGSLPEGGTAAHHRKHIVIDRGRHRDRKTEARQAVPAPGRGTATRKAPAKITICGPLAA